ncbi:hypothetical protein [Paenibacillus larvae]|uniref:hypothetical protein n=1 Tax=Paenibacillus larvae TaxID=1464 RepID=UPI0023A91BE6|nr:hypothetical protein [Paenibacillus larvae]MDE5125083.1 hypothetical protein [Paenibacillus larvae subsp. larvae]
MNQMVFNSYLKYYKWIRKRVSRESINLFYKKILDVFYERDRMKIVNFLVISSKVLVIIPLLLFTTLYLLVETLSSAQLVAGVCLSGFLSSIHTLLSLHFKFSHRPIDYLKNEFRFVLRLLPKRKEPSFILKRLSLDLVGGTLIYSIVPYFFSLLIILFVNPALWVLLLGLVFILFNYLLGLSLLIGKILNKKGLSMSAIGMVVLLLIEAIRVFDFQRAFQINSQHVFTLFLKNEPISFPSETQGLLLTILLSVFFLFCYIYSHLRKNRFTCSIFKDRETVIETFSKNKVVYQRLLLRGFYLNNKVQKLRIGTMILVLSMIVSYPLLSQNSSIPLTLTILVFSYTPSVFNLIINFYLYDGILEKRFMVLTYYFLRKFNCQNYLLKQTVFPTISQSFVLLFPYFVLLMFLKPVDMLAFIVLYVLIFFSTIILTVIRIYNLKQYDFDQMKTLNSDALISKPIENYIIFGTPILYSMPLAVIQLTQSHLLYTYLCMIGYTSLFLVYCLIKICFLIRGGKRC